MSCLQQRKNLQDTNGVETDHEMRRLSQEARFIAQDLVTYRIGKANPAATRTATTMRRLSDELEEKHATLLANMCYRLNTPNGSTHTKFVQVADEVFRDGVNWGRIVAVFAFGAKLAEHYTRSGSQGNVDEVVDWVGSYISSLSGWIQTHGGWEAFNETFNNTNDEREKAWWRKVCLAAVGVGAVMTLIYQQSC